VWYKTYYKNRALSIVIVAVLSIASLFSLPFLKVVFNFEQFFPTGDKDLEFFQDFIKEFETDDNFLLIAFKNEPSVFESDFLEQVGVFADSCHNLPFVLSVQSLTNLTLPKLGPVGPVMSPLIDSDNAATLKSDSLRIVNDERFAYNLINKDATALVVALKTADGIQLEESRAIVSAVKKQLKAFNFDDYHMLGRAYFQTELSLLQIREIIISTVISGILISIIMILIFRRWRTILIALSSISLALILFLGLLSVLGRQLSIMAALYPILMLIVGTSDVIHIMTKYMDELVQGNTKKQALETTIRQIGMATLMTSLTTAVGFATLLSSRILPIREFGVNSAMGVLVAFLVMIFFTCPLMSLFDKEQIAHKPKSKINWHNFLVWCYQRSKQHAKIISLSFGVFIILSAIGISRIHMNYDMQKNLPKGVKITEDFGFFEKEFAGFRPLEIACFIKPQYDVFDYEVVSSIAKTEDYMRSKDAIQTSSSIAMLVKSVNELFNFNKPGSYEVPDSLDYDRIKTFMKQTSIMGSEALISEDRRKTRISSRLKDVGSENIKNISIDIDKWIVANIDSSVVTMKQTGTGLILDKNSEFVRASLLQGLGFAILIVSVLMALLFRRFKYLFISVIPNLVPLVFAAALIGFSDIPLESGTAIVFAIIFGIAVDDTIHFMSKYRMALNKYSDTDKALFVTFTETGKAIIYTSIILFFGFLVMLFSKNQPSVIIGLLISVTLISAIVADLLLLPVIIRLFDRQ